MARAGHLVPARASGPAAAERGVLLAPWRTSGWAAYGLLGLLGVGAYFLVATQRQQDLDDRAAPRRRDDRRNDLSRAADGFHPGSGAPADPGQPGRGRHPEYPALRDGRAGSADRRACSAILRNLDPEGAPRRIPEPATDLAADDRCGSLEGCLLY